MPNIPGAWLNGQKVSGIVDGTIISGAQFIAFGQQGQILIYDGDPATGNLIGSWSGMAGSDNDANSYPIGLGLQGAGDVLTITGSGGQMITATIAGGTPELLFSTGAAAQDSPGALTMGQGTIGGVSYMFVTLFAPTVTGSPEGAGISLNSAPETGSSFDAGGDLNYYDSSGTLHDVLVWGSGGVQVHSPIASDTNAYQTERLTLAMPGDSPLTINTTPPGQQVFATASVGTGTYHVHGQLGVAVASAGQPSFEFGGAAASAGMRILFRENSIQSPTYINDNSAWVTGFASAFTGATMTGGDDRIYEFDGTVVVNSAGDFALFAATSNDSDTYEIYGYASYMELNPIGQ